MKRHEFLQSMHRLVHPRTYLEIGVADGSSLTLSRTLTVAIDPAFRIAREVRCDLDLVKATSDDYFARDDALAHFGGTPVDFAFIDGLHLFEYALRDFMNVESRAAWTSVVVLDDMLPRSVNEAARDRKVLEWAGDVYKLILVLRRFRPDLVVVPVDTEPTGVVLVLGADPANTVLRDNYHELLSEYVTLDPQDVPRDILDRVDAADPRAVVESDVWQRLEAARLAGTDHDAEIYNAAAALIGTRPPGEVHRPTEAPWPPPKQQAAASQRPATPQPLVRRAAHAVRWRTKKLVREVKARR